jgi:hypothetical protein
MKKGTKGSFIKTPMSGEPMYIRLDIKQTQYIKKMFPELESFLEKDECLNAGLLKAVYGCIQANVLWFSLI